MSRRLTSFAGALISADMPKGVYERTEKYRKEISERNKKLGIKPPGTLGLRWKLSEATKKRQSKAQKGKKCPWAADSLPHHRGKNHYNWKGGITPINYLIRQSAKYKKWQRAVYKRDNWTCQICGKHCRKDIIAHHIKPFNEFPELRFVVKNGMVLCKKCHLLVHFYPSQIDKN